MAMARSPFASSSSISVSQTHFRCLFPNSQFPPTTPTPSLCSALRSPAVPQRLSLTVFTRRRQDLFSSTAAQYSTATGDDADPSASRGEYSSIFCATLHLKVLTFARDSSWLTGVIFMSRRRNIVIAVGLLAFASAGLAFPFYFVTKSLKQPVIDSSKPLPPQATFRGPYVNTGSRDIGPDHQTYPKK